MGVSKEQVLAAYAALARRYGFDPDHSDRAVDAALRMVEELAPAPRDEAAVLFYAFARFPRAFPGALRLMPVLLAKGALSTQGRVLLATADELDQLVFAVARQEANVEAVQAWFVRRAPAG